MLDINRVMDEDIQTRAESEQRLAALYKSHYGKVMAFARRRVGHAEAQEVTADAFVAAWRNLDHLTDDPLPWLYQVANNAIANARRGDSRRERLHQSIAFQRPSRKPVDVDGDAQADVVLAAFESLSERDREVLRLVHWESLSTREAAAVLGCSETAMKVRLHRARSRLRRLVNTDSTPGGDAAEPVLDRTDSRMNEGRSRSVPFSASPTYLRMIVVEENVQ